MVQSRRVVNAVSLSRIGFAFTFVLCFQPSLLLFRVALAMCVLALASDVGDGYLARRLHVASVQGRLWDSLGDKAFYVAVIVAFNAHGFLSPLVSWALIVREIALYITRILFIDKLTMIERIRPLTNWHGYSMYLTIGLGLFRMSAEINGRPIDLDSWMQGSAYVALVCGVASVFHFLKLK